MNIFYNNNTLYINLEEEINEYNMNKLKSRVFKIVRDYNIDDVILKVNSYKNTLVKNYEKGIDFISKWIPGKELKYMIEGCNAQIRM